MAEKIPPESFVCRLRSGRLEDWDLYRCHEPAGNCQLRLRRVPDDAAPGDRLRCLDIQTVDAAIEWLRVCATDSDDMITLREVLRGEALPPSRTGNHDVIEQVAAMVARRELCVVVAVPVVRPAFVEKAPSAPARRAPTPSQLRPPEAVPIDIGDVLNSRFWIEVELVGEDGSPCPGEKYRVKCPDGSIETGSLDELGRTRIALDQPGTCDISFPDFDKDAWGSAR